MKTARLLTPGDRLLIALLLAASVFLYLPRHEPESGQTEILILSDGRITKSLEPGVDAEGSVQGPLGESRYVLQKGRIRMKSSPCPNQTCIRMGKIQRSGDMIVCIPNRIAIRIVKKGDPDLDGVTF